MEDQLQLLPEKPITPKTRKVCLSELPESIPGPEPDKTLVESVSKFGILQNIGLIESDSGYQIAYGRRRIKSARKLELISIPANIYPVGWTPREVLTLVENQRRKSNLAADLEAVEALRLRATTDEICLAVGMSKPQLGKILKLIDSLIPQLRQALNEGRMTASTAHKAVRLTPEQQEHLAALETIKAKDVDELLRVNTSQLVNELPDFLFEEVQPVSWEARADQLLTDLLETVPQESELHEQIQQLAEALTAKAV
jgi:ParB/RepB/Spo0J family partition protein